ncbi:MAG: hypothetical protein MI975_23205 [Cytophagales bacterium]|nr:hypothetical protein [Cytophagales bacterium]
MQGGGNSSGLSLAGLARTPQISLPMHNTSFSFKAKAGGAWWGVFGAPYVNGFYNEQKLKNDKIPVSVPAYGYLNYEYAVEDHALLDVNREKDGVVTGELPNLPIPSLTYDIYSVHGQGVSAMYRPFRNEIAMIHDPYKASGSSGKSLGVELGAIFAHAGVNGSINMSESTSGLWSDNNGLLTKFNFQTRQADDRYEPWSFKVHGEKTVGDDSYFDGIGGSEAVRVRLGGSKRNPTIEPVLENKNWSNGVFDNDTDHRARKPRGQVISPVTNEDLLKNTQEVIDLYKADYIDQNGLLKKFDRSTYPSNHMAGMIATTNDGLRYVYAIPAYNHKQEEVQFSALAPAGAETRTPVGNGDLPGYAHPGTDEFLDKTEIPAYAHSFLLTSIVGPDYVDRTGDGVTEDDLGYWVKFTYQRITGAGDYYKWRTPFSKAIYIRGLRNKPRDDRGMYSYGEKDIWYLKKAETRSHIAEFVTEVREDSRGAYAALQDANTLGKQLRALKEIKLYTRSAGSVYPIKRVKFEYDYSLCPGVFNSTGQTGKLTLKKVWFEYGHSAGGSLNPYVFTYHPHNPEYDIHAFDRWGNYKPYPPGDYLHNQDFPFVEQDPSKKDQLDAYAAAWSLKEIRLPSGGKIIVDYEADDYGYVQHRQAMQMTEIADPAHDPSGKLLLSDNDTKIFFKLEAPIENTGLSAQEQRMEVLKYLDSDRKQLYFRALINLRSPSEDYEEFISGYADIDFAAEMGLEAGASGDYTYGYFHLIREQGRHPFSLRAWQHLRVNEPDVASILKPIRRVNSDKDIIRNIKGMASVIPQVKQMFSGFNTYCSNRDWGREVAVGKSWVRLNSPDRIKYGGGLRVKQLTLMDNWEEEGIYGQIYRYTTEENGAVISSGVAANEPVIGGEENALRYAKKYTESVSLRSDNNLFTEFPLNETYYPGPHVGYGKVTVKSLATAALEGEAILNVTLSDGQGLFPEGQDITYGTTGAAVHEFYTARDFPVISDETEKFDWQDRKSVPIPLIGTISANKLSSSQGYSIITNDMHGKPKQVSHYRQNNRGTMEEEPISWVKYNYLAGEEMYEKNQVRSLNNLMKDNGDRTISTLSAEERANPSVSKVYFGQEQEFFVDARQRKDHAWEAGANYNTDFCAIPLLFVVITVPFPTVWPNASEDKKELNTIVANKVIFRSGILESIEAYDGGSRVKTQHLKWDKLTGQPVLSLVNNNFDDPVYTYDHPAYYEYEGMGPAYENIGLTLSLNSVKKTAYKDNMYHVTLAPGVKSVMHPGDEMILKTASDTTAVGLGIYLGEDEGKDLIYYDGLLQEDSYTGLITRSGKRNQLTVSAGSITALEDPTQGGTSISFGATVVEPEVK